MRHLRQCKAHVRPVYETMVYDSDIAMERSSTLGLRLTGGLSHKASNAVEPSTSDLDPLKKNGGHNLLVAAMEKLVKAEALRTQQKFDDIFKRRSARRHGQHETRYIRKGDSGTTCA